MTRTIELTNSAGTELTSGNSSGLNPGLYKFTHVHDTDDLNYAYIGVDGNLSLRIESINVYTVSTGGTTTLAGEIQYYNEGTWALDASWIKKTSSNFSYNAAASATYNVIFTDEVIDGTPIRIKLETDVESCTVYIKALKK